MRKSEPAIITKRMWGTLNQKVDNLMSQLLHIEKILSELSNRPKRYLKFEESVPPTSVCKDVFSMLGVGNYEGFIGKLSEYYDCEPMKMLVDRKRIEDYEKKYERQNIAAVYYYSVKTAYSKENSVSEETVLHEWFHHMVALNVVIIPKNKEEHYAEKYVKAFINRI